MKKFCTLLFFSLFLITATNAQTINYIWGGPGDANSEFNGGLNDWTTIGVSSLNADSAANTLWTWTSDGALSNGSFWGTRSPISSLTPGNGAAGFNSDFLDNKGDGIDSLGTGASPSPHRGELISPVIDASGHNTVYLRFYQYHRNFDASTIVEVTNGTDSTTYLINDDVARGASNTDDIVLLDISEIAANESNVRVKFIFDGDYYFWIVDDVALVEKPPYNIAISEYFFPLLSPVTPVSQISTDTMGFSAEVANLGADEQYDVELKIRIFNEDFTNELFADSLVIDTLPAGFGESIFENEDLDSTSVAFGFDTTFFVPDLAVGLYYIVYSTSIEGQDDFNPEDNIAIEPFFVTEDQFAKEYANALRSGIGNQPTDFKAGNMYTMSPASQEDYVAASYTFSAFAQDDNNNSILEGLTVSLLLVELNEDELNGSFADFDVFQDVSADNTQLSTVGINSYTFTSEDAAEDFITADILDFNDPELSVGAPLKKGNRYFALASYATPNNVINHGISRNTTEAPAYHSGVNTVFWDGGDARWYFGFSNSPYWAFILRMNIDLATTVDNVPLPEHAVKVFPNPTAEYINLDLDLEESGHATVTIADLSGRVLRIDEIDNVQRELRQYEVGQYAAGYLFNSSSHCIGN